MKRIKNNDTKEKNRFGMKWTCLHNKKAKKHGMYYTYLVYISVWPVAPNICFCHRSKDEQCETEINENLN